MALRLERVTNQGFEAIIRIAQRYSEAEITSSHLAGVATKVNLFCWVPCQEFV